MATTVRWFAFFAKNHQIHHHDLKTLLSSPKDQSQFAFASEAQRRYNHEEPKGRLISTSPGSPNGSIEVKPAVIDENSWPALSESAKSPLMASDGSIPCAREVQTKCLLVRTSNQQLPFPYFSLQPSPTLVIGTLSKQMLLSSLLFGALKVGACGCGAMATQLYNGYIAAAIPALF